MGVGHSLVLLPPALCKAIPGLGAKFVSKLDDATRLR